MRNLLAIVSLLLGAGSSLLLLVLLLASMPNGEPATLREIRSWMLSVGVIGLTGLGTGVWALIRGQAGLAAGLGFAPALYGAVVMVILLRRGA